MSEKKEGTNCLSDDEDDDKCGLDELDEVKKRIEKSKQDESFDDSYNLPIMDELSSITDVKQLENDKLAVYKHPLFPLLEKCEQATKTLGWNDVNCLKNSFNSEVQEFLHHQQSVGKSLLSENIEVDTLMVKSIQVLRIHLLELGKVQDLCKDFCQRYINCLRVIMNSENLLKCNRKSYENVDFEASSWSPSSVSEDEEKSNSSLSIKDLNLVKTDLSQTSTKPITHSFKSFPIHGYNISSHSNKSEKKPSASKGPQLDSGNEDDFSDEAFNSNQRKNQKRGILPKQATSVMKSWLFQHLTHPYPTEDEKKAIAAQTNLTLLQVNNWFINARRRILQPMLDSATNNSNLNQNGSNNASKKLKTFSKQSSFSKI